MMHQGVAVPDLQESALGIPLTSLCRAVQLGDLYENDSIFDKFDCCFSGDGTQVGPRGTYSNCFRVVSRGDSRSGRPRHRPGAGGQPRPAAEALAADPCQGRASQAETAPDWLVLWFYNVAG